MPGAKDYQQDFERLMAPLEEKQDRLQERAGKDLIAMAKKAGIGEMTFLRRFLASDDERLKVMKEILEKIGRPG